MSRSVPYTVPFAAPSYGPPPYHMKEGRVLMVTFGIDPEAAGRAVSPPLSLVPGSEATAFIGDMLQIPHCGRFHEGGVLFQVRHGQVEAPYTPYLWTSTEEAMLVGREVYGMPKVLCDDDTPLRWSGNQVIGVVRRRGQEVMTIEVNLEQELDPAAVPRRESRLTVRTIPDPTGATVCRREVLHSRLTNYQVHEAWTGRGLVRFHPTVHSRVHELQPVQPVVTGYYMRTSWTLDRVECLHSEDVTA